MKGIVFNLLEEIVAEEHGEDLWDNLLERAQVEGAYTAVGTYPHGDLHKLVEAATSVLDQPAEDVLRWFGRNALGRLRLRYPAFFEGHDSARSFTLTLNEVIHPEVRKLFPGAYAPEFDFELPGPDSVALGYRSYRGLCMFAEGLVQGTADSFGEEVTIEQTSCTSRGDLRCVLVCTFSKPA